MITFVYKIFWQRFFHNFEKEYYTDKCLLNIFKIDLIINNSNVMGFITKEIGLDRLSTNVR